MENIQYIGYVATVLQVMMYFPQIYKIYINKSAEGISIKTYFLNLIGIYSWSFYSSMIGMEGIAAFIANMTTLIVLTPTVVMVLKYRNKNWLPIILLNITILITCILIFIFNNKINVNGGIENVMVILGGGLGAITFVPQAIETIRVRKIINFSMTLAIMRFISTILWMVYWLLMYLEQVRASYIISTAFTILSAICVIPIIFVGFMQYDFSKNAMPKFN